MISIYVNWKSIYKEVDSGFTQNSSYLVAPILTMTPFEVSTYHTYAHFLHHVLTSRQMLQTLLGWEHKVEDS